MGNLTLKVPDELHEAMRRHPEIRWSEIARRAFQMELERLEVYDRLLANSRVTVDDAVRIGREVRRAQAKKLHAKIAQIRARKNE